MTLIKSGFAPKAPKKQCRIITSWCTCTAGTGEVCNHVIALLYKVNYAFKKDYVDPACTSVPQGWNIGTRKEVLPRQLRCMIFRKHKKTRKNTNRNPDMDQTLRKEFDPRKPDDRVLTNERVSSLLMELKNVFHLLAFCIPLSMAEMTVCLNH